MKKAVFFLLASCMLLLSCGTVRNNVRRRHFNHSLVSELRRNGDGTKNVYVVDSIPFDTVYYEIVEHNYGLFNFYVPKGYIEKHRRVCDHTLLKEKFAILTDESGLLQAYAGKKFKDEKIPRELAVKNPYTPFMKSKHMRFSSYTIREYNDALPTYLRVYMVRGDCYNRLVNLRTRHMWPLRFPNKKAYYKVVVPVWSDKPFVPK